MNIQCAICQESLTPAEDINIIPCGHVFHFPCLNAWLDNSLTCPQCRLKVRRDKITKIYFNFANVEAVKEDSYSLQQKVDNLSFQGKLYEAEIKKNNEELANLKRQNTGLRDEVRRAESEVHRKNSAIYALKEQTEYFKNKSMDYDQLKEQNNRLCKTLETYDNVQLLITSSGEEVDKMLGANKDITTLTTYAAVLKRELNVNMEKRKELRAIIRNLQSEVQALKIKRDSFAHDYIKKIEDLEEELIICKSEREALQSEILELKQRANNPSSSNEECIGEFNSVSENTTSRKRDIDAEENSDLIPKKIKKSQVFKLSSSPNKDDSDIVFIEPTSYKTTENSQDSPYLPTKSKGILSMKSRTLSGNRSSNWIQSTGNSINLKNVSSSKIKNTLELDLTRAFDGFGGHSKVETFSAPKSSPNKLKRPSSDIGKSKKLKLDLDRNNKIDDYVINLT
ncbi:E3 ubiquitin-protein ligase TRAIP-like [Phymastichus coffea]|uniref:E3 ubiquitin-protein ligase TRAIP-like n=1 Tax=Phymastichus coffea TaxID=108790 RepID=UPI00273BD616|nr:E3 ubiquitin-protein ligase TRAIP-like [Phymastichus coffea]